MQWPPNMGGLFDDIQFHSIEENSKSIDKTSSFLDYFCVHMPGNVILTWKHQKLP